MVTESESNEDRQLQTRIIVKFNESVRNSENELEDQCKQIRDQLPGGNLVRPPSKSGRAVFDVESSADLSELAEKISALDCVEYAEPDVVDSQA